MIINKFVKDDDGDFEPSKTRITYFRTFHYSYDISNFSVKDLKMENCQSDSLIKQSKL